MIKRKAQVNTGLKTNNEINIRTGEASYRKAFRFIILFIFCLSSSMGLLLATAEAFAIPHPAWVMMLVGGFCLAFSIAFFKERYRKVWVALPSIALVVWAVLRFRRIVNSLAALLGYILEVFNEYFHTNMAVVQPFKNKTAESPVEGLALLFTVTAVILAFGMFRLKRWYLNIALLAAGILYPLLGGVEPGDLPVYLALFGGVGTIAVKGYLRSLRREAFPLPGFHAAQAGIGLTAAILAVLSLLCGSMVLKPAVKKAFKNKQEVKGKIRGLWDNPLGVIETQGNGGVGNGDLRNCDEFTGGYRTQLKITVSEKPTGPLYIQGYIGGSYEDNQWKPSNAAAFNELMQNIDTEYPSQVVRNQTFHFANRFYDYGVKEDKSSIKARTVKIQNVGANRKYGYYPYGTRFQEGLSFMGDSYVEAGRMKGYNATYYPLPAYNQWKTEGENLWAFPEEADTDWIVSESHDYMENEDAASLYQYYMDERYLSVPDKLQEAFREDTDKINGRNGSEISREIASLLRKNTTYSTKPGALPKGRDFAEYFFYENQKGYCMHYATTAALMLRMKEIPSRFVAGFVVWGSQFEKKDDGSYEANVTGNNAHAWAEAYDPLAGWVPVETTPGYSGSNPEGAAASNRPNQDNTNQTDTEKKPQKETETPKETTDAGDKGGTGLPGIFGGKNAVAVWPFSLLLLAVLAAAVLLIRRRRRRQKEEASSDFLNNRKVIRRFQGFYELLTAAGMKRDFNYSEQTIKDFLFEKDSRLNEEALDRTLKTVMQASFSGHEISREERDLAESTLSGLTKTITSGLSPWQKTMHKIKHTR